MDSATLASLSQVMLIQQQIQEQKENKTKESNKFTENKKHGFGTTVHALQFDSHFKMVFGLRVFFNSFAVDLIYKICVGFHLIHLT